mmetsp:Transcript_90233/g.243742  ORF Transcript_90233/g.243742 Transcript_90233/m.243742 type:complete len:251 (+) Transcript_90233:1-753(+)
MQDGALSFLDAAFEHVGIAGADCFAASRWGRGMGLDLAILLSIYEELLRGIAGVTFNSPAPATAAAVAAPVAGPPEDSASPSHCAEEPIAPAGAPTGTAMVAAARVRLSCLVPLVWPAERVFREAILRTYGPECDELRFFVAGDGVAAAAGGRGGFGEVIDLRATFPRLPRDRQEFHRVSAEGPSLGSANTIAKMLHMLLWAADEHGRLGRLGRTMSASEVWWFCRLERDTYFLPENFRFGSFSRCLGSA